MAAITKIEFWSDVGFVDGAVEIPHVNAPDPTNPDVTIEEEILPSKDRFFSELKLKEYYTGLLTMSYMRVTYDLKNSLGIDTPNVFYGWVDSVKLSSDGELPMTMISWHIDEWRTWKNAITFGSGHVKRRPFRDLATTPIQNYGVRYFELGDTDQSLIDVHKKGTMQVWWVIISFNITDDGKTKIVRLTYPVFLTTASNTDCYFVALDQNNTEIAIHGTPLNSIYDGLLDEDLAKICGVTPEALNGVWISPLSPRTTGGSNPLLPVSGSGTQLDPYRFPFVPPTKYYNGTLGMLPLFGNSAMVKITKTFDEIVSSEQHRYNLTSTDGIRILEFPYGYSTDSVTISFVNEPDGPYLEFSFKHSSYGNLEGMVVNIPLTMLPVNSNAYTSYAYSGKQQYDREMRVVQSNANAWKSSAGGAGTGAMMGAFGPAGLAVGAVGGMTGGLVSYGVEMLYQNDEEQRLENRLQANQPSSLILTSNSLLSIARAYGFVIKDLTPDDYSDQQLIATRNQFGISVDELMSSCDSLIRTTSPTGYYNIQNMIVNGNVPVSAKKWIREKFRSGVRLI